MFACYGWFTQCGTIAFGICEDSNSTISVYGFIDIIKVVEVSISLTRILYIMFYVVLYNECIVVYYSYVVLDKWTSIFAFCYLYTILAKYLRFSSLIIHYEIFKSDIFVTADI